MPHPYEDRLALEAWMNTKLAGATDKRVDRFIRALNEMPLHQRTRFLAAALLCAVDLEEILPDDG